MKNLLKGFSTFLVLLFFSESLRASKVDYDLCRSYGPNDAKTFFYNGKAETAILILKCILNRYPEDADIMRSLADFYWWLGNEKESLEIAQKILQLNPEKVDPETLSHVKKRLKIFQLLWGAEGVSAKNNIGYEFSALGIWNYYRKNKVNLGIQRLYRSFGDPDLFNLPNGLADNIISISHTAALNSKLYVDTQFIYTLKSFFSPLFGFTIEPHYVLPEGSEIYATIRVNHYRDINVLQINTGYLFLPSELLQTNFRIFLSFTSKIIFSASLSLAYQFTPKVNLAAFISGGRTLESANIENDFLTPALVVKYQFNSQTYLYVNASHYSSDYRYESRLGFKLEHFW